MKMTFRFEGGKELAAALGKLPERVSRRIATEVLMDVAEPMRSKMESAAPRGDEAPHLADNIIVSAVRAKRDDFGSLSGPSVAIGPMKGIEHGHLQEFGTVHHGPQPFARPAFDSEAQRTLAEINRRLWVELAGKGIHRPTVSAPSEIDDFGSSGGAGLGAGNVQRRGGTGL